MPEHHNELISSLKNILPVVIAILIALLCRHFVLSTYRVVGSSMETTLHNGDIVVVSKLGYGYWPSLGSATVAAPRRGDIVIVEGIKIDGQYHDLIKRVIGLPGDHLTFLPGEVLVNGHVLAEPSTALVGKWAAGPIVVPAHEYFVLGDNRDNSQDSRFFGPVQADEIVGRVVWRVFPLAHAGSPTALPSTPDVSATAP